MPRNLLGQDTHRHPEHRQQQRRDRLALEDQAEHVARERQASNARRRCTKSQQSCSGQSHTKTLGQLEQAPVQGYQLILLQRVCLPQTAGPGLSGTGPCGPSGRAAVLSPRRAVRGVRDSSSIL
jgi:hypothetical protein